LRAKRHPGAKPKLAREDRPKLAKLLLKGPLAHGYWTDLWTLQRVAQLIEKHFGVHYHPSSVWRLLRAMGWTAQKPERRARERNEEAIRRWRRRDWVRIKKSPPPEPKHRLH
jgi:transposase